MSESIVRFGGDTTSRELWEGGPKASTGMSRLLNPANRSFSMVAFQQAKPLQDAEINLAQQVQNNLRAEILRKLLTSGMLSMDIITGVTSPRNTVRINNAVANINGWLLKLDGANRSDNYSDIIFPAAPFNGTREDLAYVEAWFQEVGPTNSPEDDSESVYKNGGITCTGGEPMMQPQFLTELFTAAHKHGIHTCLDTSGICFDPENTGTADRILDVTDLVMLDIKHIDDEMHRKLTGHSNAGILAFAQHIAGRGVPLWIRHVIVPGWTDGEDEQERLGFFIGGLSSLKGLDVLPYHDMGKRKYEELGIPYPLADTKPVSKETAAAAREQIMRGIKKRLHSKID